MKVFITWSGDSSFIVAKALRDFVATVVQSATPFMSETDIEKGSRWESIVSEELNSADAGVICLTPENVTSPWVLFEAGALSRKKAEKSGTRVCTYLHRLAKSDVQPPLSMFQHTLANKDETRRLISEFREDSKAPAESLEKLFDRMWPDLDEALKKVVPEAQIVPRRPDDKIDEMLELVRGIARTQQDQMAIDRYQRETLSQYLYQPYGQPASRTDLTSSGARKEDAGIVAKAVSNIYRARSSQGADPKPGPSSGK